MSQDRSWSNQMKQVVDRLREGAKGYSEEEIDQIVDEAVAAVRREHRLKKNKQLKLRGALKETDIDFEDLKQYKKQTWQHVDQEFSED